jgi:hypothetical protein
MEAGPGLAADCPVIARAVLALQLTCLRREFTKLRCIHLGITLRILRCGPLLRHDLCLSLGFMLKAMRPG